MDTQLEPRRRRPRVTVKAWKIMVEPQARVIEVDMWVWQTSAESVQLRAMVESEGRRRPSEPEEWRVEAQLKTLKTEAEPE